MSKRMKRQSLAFGLLSAAAAILIITSMAGATTDVVDYDNEVNQQKIDALLERFENMSEDELNSLEALEVTSWKLPSDSVDVMRARITETYILDGIGEDTVNLTGWVAVKHYNARPVDGSGELTWNNAVTETEFIGMKLHGYSDVFGPVKVTLTEGKRVFGEVGRIEIPENAREELIRIATNHALEESRREPIRVKIAEAKDGNVRIDAKEVQRLNEEGAVRQSGLAAPVASPDGLVGQTEEATEELDLRGQELLMPGVCAAPVEATIDISDLGLKLEAAGPVNWYSLVETIPPVGHTASIAIDPVDLLSEGRKVGTLVGGTVNFREVVYTVNLTPTAGV